MYFHCCKDLLHNRLSHTYISLILLSFVWSLLVLYLIPYASMSLFLFCSHETVVSGRRDQEEGWERQGNGPRGREEWWGRQGKEFPGPGGREEECGRLGKVSRDVGAGRKVQGEPMVLRRA